MNKKFMIRHNLSMYGETKFAEKLQSLGYQTFFPFKDIGIDLVAVDYKLNNNLFFQVKTRTRNALSYKQPSLGDYWFEMKTRDIEKNFNIRNMFWVFCIVLDDYSLDFFVIPIKKLKEWIDYSKLNRKKAILGVGNKKQDVWYFQPTINDTRFNFNNELKNAKFITTPLMGSMDITQYLFDEFMKKI